MYKVMLVDDDYPTIEFLTEVIDWHGLELELLSTHENGQSALDAAKKELPDILVTDIGMPKLDGIKLTRELKALKENLQVAIISCHNEFNYAQQALKLNVQDYLLKETLDPEDLMKILRKCKNRLDNDANQKTEMKKLRHKLDQHHDLENHQLLKQYIQGTSNSFIQFTLDQANQYIPAQYVINDFYEKKWLYLSEDTLLFAIHNIAKEVITGHKTDIAMIHYEQNKGFLFYKHLDTIKQDNYGELRSVLRDMQKAINQYLSINITFLIGTNQTASSLNKELDQLIKSDKQLFYTKKNSIEQRKPIDKLKQEKIDDDIMHCYQAISANIKKAIYQRDFSSLEAHIQAWTDFFGKKSYYEPELVKEWFLRMLLELKMKLRTVHYFQTNYQAEAIQQDILTIDSLQELKDYVYHYLKKCLSESNQILKNAYHKDVLSACYYVSSNIESKFSLDDVAEYLYLNASYFSRLFKKEMQITFVEYVKQQKIYRAKELLEFTDHSIGAICERLGYDNQSYFIKIFKQQTGFTPLEYRNKLLQGAVLS